MYEIFYSPSAILDAVVGTSFFLFKVTLIQMEAMEVIMAKREKIMGRDPSPKEPTGDFVLPSESIKVARLWSLKVDSSKSQSMNFRWVCLTLK